MFGQRVELNIQGEREYTTTSGGILTLLLGSLLISIMYKKTYEFISKEEVSIYQTKTFEQEPSLLNLTDNNFMFAVQIQQTVYDYIQNPYFIIEVQQRHYERDDEGNLNKIQTPMILEPCTIDHWRATLGNETYELLSQFDINNYLCPPIGYDELALSGVYYTENFDFVKINVVDCYEAENNKGYYQKWDYECLDADTLSKAVDQEGDLKFQIIASNNIVNPQDEKTIQKYITEEYYFTFKPGELFVQADIFIQHQTMEIYNNLFPYQSENIEDFVFPVMEPSEVKETYTSTKYEGEYSSFYLRKSRYTTTIEKSFMSFEDLLSYIGGFANVLYIVIGLVAYELNYEQQLIEVANSLYFFKRNNQQGGGNNNNKIQNNEKRVEIQQNYPLGQRIYQPFNQKKRKNLSIQKIIDKKSKEINKQGFTSRFEFLSSKLKEKIFRTSNVTLNVQYFIYRATMGRFFNNEETQLVDKARDLASSQLDVLKLINRIQEIERLKNVLLTRDQITLFNYFPKPLVQVDPNKEIKDKLQHDQLKNLSVQNQFSKQRASFKQRQSVTITKALYGLKHEEASPEFTEFQNRLGLESYHRLETKKQMNKSSSSKMKMNESKTQKNNNNINMALCKESADSQNSQESKCQDNFSLNTTIQQPKIKQKNNKQQQKQNQQQHLGQDNQNQEKVTQNNIFQKQKQKVEFQDDSKQQQNIQMQLINQIRSKSISSASSIHKKTLSVPLNIIQNKIDSNEQLNQYQNYFQNDKSKQMQKQNAKIIENQKDNENKETNIDKKFQQNQKINFYDLQQYNENKINKDIQMEQKHYYEENQDDTNQDQNQITNYNMILDSEADFFPQSSTYRSSNNNHQQNFGSLNYINMSNLNSTKRGILLANTNNINSNNYSINNNQVNINDKKIQEKYKSNIQNIKDMRDYIDSNPNTDRQLQNFDTDFDSGNNQYQSTDFENYIVQKGQLNQEKKHIFVAKSNQQQNIKNIMLNNQKTQNFQKRPK
ncbi:hypothetical protein PPERSA_04850 [Pseudocohnilembus persalinus]|uniref:Transmembrane protein n=1 Tax=Pseudocohnilembus persalinus TaxID=266149 RepID=A0A0V0QJ15_PSEPJ|nr:hypothetical protein PPERSA_04850 [Pseudocohnilembus persalinus]|eukprot:KRX02228.1 hypothetical protein PPERSA_04850 [Pseudocohnilembus persalinus]